jgi:hypothetical protein
VYILSNSPGTILDERTVPPPDRPAREMTMEPHFRETVLEIGNVLHELEEGKD